MHFVPYWTEFVFLYGHLTVSVEETHMTTQTTPAPLASFYYGKQLLGIVALKSTIKRAFEDNKVICESLDRHSLPYLPHCTHVSIWNPVTDKELDVKPSDTLWDAHDGLSKCLNQLAC